MPNALINYIFLMQFACFSKKNNGCYFCLVNKRNPQPVCAGRSRNEKQKDLGAFLLMSAGETHNWNLRVGRRKEKAIEWPNKTDVCHKRARLHTNLVHCGRFPVSQKRHEAPVLEADVFTAVRRLAIKVLYIVTPASFWSRLFSKRCGHVAAIQWGGSGRLENALFTESTTWICIYMCMFPLDGFWVTNFALKCNRIFQSWLYVCTLM